MKYSSAVFAIAATTLLSIPASAQGFSLSRMFGYSPQPPARSCAPDYSSQRPPNVGGGSYGSWRQTNRIDVRRLEQYADELALVASHLHDDVRDLKCPRAQSQALMHYVTELEALQHHLHEILRDAVDRGGASSRLIGYVTSDFRDARTLATRLGQELDRQLQNGVQGRDARRILHMREIIAHEMLPLLSRVDRELRRGTTSVHYRQSSAPRTGFSWSFGF